MSVRELFRRKLDGAEVIPGPAVNAKLMRTLARREFVRFNPARFNAYYVGGLLVAAVTISIILFSEKENSTQSSNITELDTTENILSIKPFELPEGKAIIKISEGQANGGKESANKKNDNQRKSKSGEVVINRILQSDRNTFTPAGINESYSKPSLVNDPSPNAGKLQGRNLKSETLFEASVLSGCVPLKIHFNAAVNSIDSCNWTFGDGGYSNKRSPDWIFDMEGEYKVVLNIYSGGNLQTSTSKIITVHPRPQARFEIAPENAVLPDDEIRFLNYSTNGMKFRWSFGDGTFSDLFEPVHKYSRYSSYNVKLVVSTEFGCSDSLLVINALSGSEYFINFPNAFIPNPGGPSGGLYSTKSDEASQVFHPASSGVADYQLRIFSKLGILIFESNDVNVGWDGYFKGQMANPGVYIWKVRGNFRNGELFVKMGDVTLLRN
jgi:PKD repeat protein